MENSVVIFGYFSPNEYLRDLFLSKKKKKSKLTLRKLADLAGLKSPGYLTNLFKGKNPVTQNLVPKFSEAFELKKYESEYLEALVLFQNAKDHSSKRKNFEKVMSLRKGRGEELDLSQYEYFTKWYYVAIREFLDCYVFKGDFKELAGKLVPKITPLQAKKAIEVLVKNKLIAQNSEGIYQKLNPVVSTGEWKSLAVADFQLATLDLAKQSFQNVAKEKRNISTLTVTLSSESLKLLDLELKIFRKKILEIAIADTQPEGVFQINLHVFPLALQDGKSTDE